MNQADLLYTLAMVKVSRNRSRSPAQLQWRKQQSLSRASQTGGAKLRGWARNPVSPPAAQTPLAEGAGKLQQAKHWAKAKAQGLQQALKAKRKGYAQGELASRSQAKRKAQMQGSKSFVRNKEIAAGSEGKSLWKGTKRWMLGTPSAEKLRREGSRALQGTMTTDFRGARKVPGAAVRAAENTAVKGGLKGLGKRLGLAGLGAGLAYGAYRVLKPNKKSDEYTEPRYY